ncbi:Subunit of heteropentameric Replication factor C (RF-C), partial [Coemansia nantahalensis]
PLASRCAKFRFKSLPRDQAVARVAHVAEAEGVVCRDGAVQALVDHSDGDLRRAMMSLQSASRMVQGAALDADTVAELAGVISPDVIQRLRAAWAADARASLDAVDDLVYAGYPASRVLAQLHDLVVADPQLSSIQKAKIAALMAAVDRALCDGADEKLQLLNLMLQASRIAQTAGA